MFSQSIAGVMRKSLLDYFLPLECMLAEAEYDKSSPTQADVIEHVKKELNDNTYVDKSKNDWIDPNFNDKDIFESLKEVNEDELDELMNQIRAEIKESY
jgi:hypothetical protein